VRHVLPWVAWWLALFWLWLLLAGEWNRVELVAAALAAAAGATFGEAARGLVGGRARISSSELAAAGRIPLALVVDFAILVQALALSVVRRRVVRGSFWTREIDAGGRDPAGTGRRAWLEYAATVSPNAYVVAIDRERGLALVHDLIPRRASEEPV
jgi:hypothetical protein